MDYFTYLRSMDYNMQNTNTNFGNISFGGTPFGNNLNNNTPWVLDFQDKSTQYNLNQLITSAKNSVTNEKEDETEYDMLARLAPNEEQKDIIYSIRDNEIIHGKIFRKIFHELTGVMLPDSIPMSNKEDMSKETEKDYMSLLKKSFMGELKAIERYREMLAYAPNKEIYSMIMYVMTDEIRHAFKYQYLMMLNK